MQQLTYLFIDEGGSIAGDVEYRSINDSRCTLTSLSNDIGNLENDVIRGYTTDTGVFRTKIEHVPI